MTAVLTSWSLWGAFLVVVLPPLLILMQEIPITKTEGPLPGTYEIVDLKTPAMSGPMLGIFSYIVAKSWFAPWILRHLLNTNGVHHIRALAATPEIKSLPSTHFPVHKARKALMEQAEQWHERNSAEIYHNGMDLQNSAPYYSIMDYRRLYESGKVTPSEVMERLIYGQAQLSHLRIFSDFIPEQIRLQAKASDNRWKEGAPLSVWDGVPVAIKDMSPTAYYEMCHGSSTCTQVKNDDFVAQRLRAAGAILVGMTVMPEGGVTPLGYSAHFDGPYNPYNLDYYPGGSSSGSAVAVAAGLVPMAVGWDGGGSIRVPASMSGVYGLKTTFGRVPFNESSGSTNIAAGPIGATLSDVALGYLLLSQPEIGSFYTDIIGEAYLPRPHLTNLVDEGRLTHTSAALEGIRLGVFWDHFVHSDPEVVTKCMEVLDSLQKRGARIVNITIPHLREIHLSHGIKILTEFGITWETEFFNKTYNLEPNTVITVALGRALKATEILAAERVRSYAIHLMRETLYSEQTLDAIVSPMIGDKVPKLPPGYKGYGESNTAKVYKIMRYVPLANFLGLPGLSVPVGYEKETGLPIGFQFLGDAWSEPTIIRLGMVLDKFIERRRPSSDNFFDVLGPWASNLNPTS